MSVFVVRAGRIITAAYVPLPNYSQLFPDSTRATQNLLTSAQVLGPAGLPNPGFMMPPGGMLPRW